jgi:uncharacterized membrane protein YgcG
MKSIYLIILLCVSISTFAQYGKVQVPPKSNDYVNDYSDVLTYDEESNLRSICSAIESTTKTQVAIVITDALYEGYAIEDFSFELANRWGIGQRYENNGLLVLICPNIRESRFEVGTGLEPVLTDIYTKRVQRSHFNPNFREGNYYLGIANALLEVKQTLVNNYQPTTAQTEVKKEEPKVLKVTPVETYESRKQIETNTGDGMGILLFVLIALGIGSLITYLIYRHYAEKQAKKDLETQANKIKADLEKEFADTKNELESMNGFLNSADILNEVNLGLLCLDDKFNGQPYEKYADIALKEKSKLKELCISVISKFRLKNNIQRDYNRKDQIVSNVRNEYNNAMAIYAQMSIKYTSYISSLNCEHPETVKKYIDQITTIFENAKQAVDKFEFAEAEANFELIMEYILNCKQFSEYINNVKKNLVNAETFLSNAKSSFANAVKETDDSMRKTYVKSSTVEEWDTYKRNTKFSVNNNTTHPLDEVSRIEAILKTIKNYKSKADKDVSNEEARQRKIREDEERARQRRMQQSTSTYNTSGGFGSSSSRSSHRSGGTSFGGGRFSGGGSSNKW